MFDNLNSGYTLNDFRDIKNINIVLYMVTTLLIMSCLYHAYTLFVFFIFSSFIYIFKSVLIDFIYKFIDLLLKNRYEILLFKEHIGLFDNPEDFLHYINIKNKYRYYVFFRLTELSKKRYKYIKNLVRYINFMKYKSKYAFLFIFIFTFFEFLSLNLFVYLNYILQNDKVTIYFFTILYVLLFSIFLFQHLNYIENKARFEPMIETSSNNDKNIIDAYNTIFIAYNIEKKSKKELYIKKLYKRKRIFNDTIFISINITFLLVYFNSLINFLFEKGGIWSFFIGLI